MPPVEQVVATVNIALRRQLFLTEYFTEGNIPDSLIGVPEGWTPDQIARHELGAPVVAHSRQRNTSQYFWYEARRGAELRTEQGAGAEVRLRRRLARLVCFAFSVSPQALDGLMHYMAEYECLDGRVIRRAAIGRRLPNFIEQP